MFWPLTLVNAVMLLIVTLYTRLNYPADLKPFSVVYSYIPDNVVCFIVVVCYSAYTGKLISFKELLHAIYGKRTKSSTDFMLNYLGFIFWQTVILVCVGF